MADSTQYNNIGHKYNDATEDGPQKMLENYHLHRAVQGLVNGASVLDLASGGGYVSKLMLGWGAASVVGIDISSKMVESAENALTAGQKKKITYQVQDCGRPGLRVEGGPFDIVSAGWLLNYADTEDAMVEMLKNVAHNLKDGGVFATIVPFPTNDREPWLAKVAVVGPKYGLLVTPLNEMGDVCKCRVELWNPWDPKQSREHAVRFDCYHFLKHIHERAVRRAGFKGDLKWIDVEVPAEFAREDGYWDEYPQAPHCGLMVVYK